MNSKTDSLSVSSISLLSVVILVLILAATLLLWVTTREQLNRASKEKFDAEIHEIEERIIRRMELYTNTLSAARGLFAARGVVTRQDWKFFVNSINLQQNYPGIQGIGFSLYVPSSELSKHIADVRKEGFPTYTVHPPGERAGYTPVLYIEPFTGANLKAFGYDTFFDPVRRQAQEKARDTGTAALTGKLTLIQELATNSQPGFILYTPIYKVGLPTATVDQRRHASLGFTNAPFRAQDFIEGILGKTSSTIAFDIYDGRSGALSQNRLLYSRDGGRYTQNPSYIPLFTTTRVIKLASHHWTISYASLPGFGVSPVEELVPLGILTGGAMFSILLFFLINTLVLSRAAAVTSARAAEQSFKETEQKYQNIFNSLSDIYVSLHLDGTVLSVSPSVYTYTGRRPESLIGKNIRDLYIDPSKHDELLKQELAQGVVHDYPVAIKGAGGRPLFMSLNARVILDTAGRPMQIEGLMRDLTDRKRAEDTLKIQKEELERLNKAFVGRELKMIELRQRLESLKHDEK